LRHAPPVLIVTSKLPTSSAMQIDAGRFLLRDFTEEDRAAFIAYQAHPSMLALYDLGDEAGARHARTLFDRFLEWQRAEPRRNIQLGIFERDGRLCGCAGLRMENAASGTAELGIELAPSHWGRYRLALDVAEALAAHGFDALGLTRIFGSTASGNARAAKLAKWFGARIVASRDGPAWMIARGWSEVVWALDREDWQIFARKLRRTCVRSQRIDPDRR
jgi:ribosomal-protein-alanine N-acetyltransferase